MRLFALLNSVWVAVGVSIPKIDDARMPAGESSIIDTNIIPSVTNNAINMALTHRGSPSNDGLDGVVPKLDRTYMLVFHDQANFQGKTWGAMAVGDPMERCYKTQPGAASVEFWAFQRRCFACYFYKNDRCAGFHRGQGIYLGWSISDLNAYPGYKGTNSYLCVYTGKIGTEGGNMTSASDATTGLICDP